MPTNTIDRLFRVIFRSFVFLLFASILTQNSLAKCKPPKHRECFVYTDLKNSIFLSIGIRLEEFAPERLVCLADAMKLQYKDRKEIDISIFDSCEAAERYSPAIPNYDPIAEEAATHVHGYYSFNAEKNENFIEIYPWGTNVNISTTRINLPVSSKPQCRLQMHGRCLLALKDIKYPADAKKARGTGNVTLTGTIDRQGKMTGVNIAETNITPIEAKDLLANKALENIKTWRFEKSIKQHQFRITYSYAINIPEGDIGQVEVRPELPDHIYINLNPWNRAK